MTGRPVESRHGAEVRLVGLSRDYGEVAAVRAVDLTIAPGEFVTLLGPSGSGKTTTLMMVAGFVHPTAGDILLDGRSVLAVAAHRRDLGVVFQSYALFPHMSVSDNVAFPLRMRHVDRREAHRRVETALEMVQLGALGSRRIHELSRGQQQRVAAAGQRVRVMIRPEALRVGPAVSVDGDMRVRGVIEEALYLVQAIRYVVRSGDALTLIARMTRRMGEADVAVGSGVTLTWSRGS